ACTNTANLWLGKWFLVDNILDCRFGVDELR
ncbi:hypothetical protein MJO29_008198, partial [Puccinia striiformis f. sp. tritici]